MFLLCISHLVVVYKLYNPCYQHTFHNLFQNAWVLFLSTIFKFVLFASFLEKLMVYFLILYFKYFHFTWSSRMFSLKSSFKVSEINFFIWGTCSSFSIKLLLNFRKPLPLLFSSFLQYENVIGEWSVKSEGRTSVFWTSTCVELEI